MGTKATVRRVQETLAKDVEQALRGPRSKKPPGPRAKVHLVYHVEDQWSNKLIVETRCGVRIRSAACAFYAVNRRQVASATCRRCVALNKNDAVWLRDVGDGLLVRLYLEGVLSAPQDRAQPYA